MTKQPLTSGAPPPCLRPLNDLIDAPPLRVRYAAPSGDCIGSDLVISFASIGRKRAIMPPDEFLGSVLKDPSRHALFVSDMSRSWLNDPALCAMLAHTVEDLMTRQNIHRVTTLGLSMGAFSALTATDLFPVDAAIAISPQYSMQRTHMPRERRWNYWRKRIAYYRHETADSAPPAKQAFLFHGLLDDLDHMRAFAPRDGLDQFVYPGQSHSTLGRHLRDRGVLPDLIAAASSGDRRRVARIAKSCGGLWRTGFERGEAG